MKKGIKNLAQSLGGQRAAAEVAGAEVRAEQMSLLDHSSAVQTHIGGYMNNLLCAAQSENVVQRVRSITMIWAPSLDMQFNLAKTCNWGGGVNAQIRKANAESAGPH